MFAALGEEINGGAVGRPLGIALSGLVFVGREGQLARVAVGLRDPDVFDCVVGGGFGDDEEDGPAIGGDAGMGDGAIVTEVFVGGKDGLRKRGERQGEADEGDAKHGGILQAGWC